MCGELDESLQINQEILERFNGMARFLGVQPVADQRPAPEALASAEGRAAYMERLFNENLSRVLSDVRAADEEETVDAIASQAIALARLAGFVAGQLPPDADLFRSVVEAMTEGHGEPARIAERIRRHHAHEHGHDHDHGHHHH